jgi:hypothetical protein
MHCKHSELISQNRSLVPENPVGIEQTLPGMSSMIFALDIAISFVDM